jgi:transposase
VGRKQAKSFTPEEKLQIVLAGLKGKATVTELCRRYGISQPTYYTWRDKVLSGAAEALSGPGASIEATQLRERVAELERALGKKTLEVEILGNVFGRSQ